MGGEERVERQHASGRLTVRERVERLFDAGTFHETGALAGWGTYEDGELRTSCPPTWSSGRAGSTAGGRSCRATTSPFAEAPRTPRSGRRWSTPSGWRAELRVPLVRLVDGTGGGGSVKSLETMGFTYVPFIPGWETAAENLSTVPVVAAALGPVAGLGAARVVASHFSVIVRGTAQLFVAGPPVVAAAMGETPRQGGAGRGARADARGRGRQRGRRRGRRARAAARASSPTCRRTSGSCRRSSPPPTRRDRREEDLLSIVPRERRKPYKARAHPRGGVRPRLGVRDRRHATGGR